MPEFKLKLQEAVDASLALDSISNNNRMSLEMQWKVTDIIESLQKHRKRYGEEQEKLLKAHGTLDENTNRYNIPPEKRDDYNKKIEELGDNQVNATFVPLMFSELKEEKISMIGREMLPLKKYFIERKEEKKEKSEDKPRPKKTPDSEE